jgi:hypothetical protein
MTVTQTGQGGCPRLLVDPLSKLIILLITRDHSRFTDHGFVVFPLTGLTQGRPQTDFAAIDTNFIEF